MSALGSKSNSFLGVDLSPDAIKVVELKPERGKPQLVTYGYTEAKGDVLKGDFINNKNITSTLLKEVSNQAKTTTNQVLAALPTSLVFSSVIKLQGLLKRDLENRQKIKALLSEELKKILPRPLEEMNFDFNLIKTEEIERTPASEKVEIARYLITAATNEVVNEYSQIFKQAGFQLTSLDIESFALVRSLIGNDKSLVMIVDIGENRTNLSIVNLTIPVLSRSIAVGGSAVTKSISDNLSITISEAETYKKDLAIMMEQEKLEEYPKPVEIAISPIITEIKYMLRTYYEQMGREKSLDKIVLTGGGSLLGNNLDKYLSQNLNIRTYVGDPWARIIYPEELKPVLHEIGPRFAVAIGLAMRGII